MPREDNRTPARLTTPFDEIAQYSTSGPAIHVADLPQRAVGEVVVISTTATTATGMVVFALEDLHVGDVVEMDQQ